MGWGLWLLVPCAVGVTLRSWRLPQQILGGDELHAVVTALYRPLGTILTTYFPSDSCIPLTALYRLWVVAGGELGEMGLRLPVLLTALAFLLAIPLLLDRGLGRPTATAFAALAAISPGLVLYGRVVRSYMPVVLWGSLAVVAFWVWWRTGRRRWAVGYGLAAALALWFHLGAGPFVVAPFVFAAGDLVLRRDRDAARPGWIALGVLGAATAAAFLVFLVPAANSLGALTADKRIDQSVSSATIGLALQLAAGTISATPAVLFWLVALAGLAALVHRRRALAVYTVVLAVVHAVGLRLLSPLGLEHPVILFRYHLIALPVVLLWVATGLAEVRRRRLRLALGGLALAGLFLAGPLTSWDFVHGSFHHDNDFFGYVRPRPRVAEERVPGIYRELAARDEPGAVLEYPWTYFWNRGQVFPLYQRIHRRDVLVAPVEEGLIHPRLDLRNAVPPSREAFAASRARYLVLHVDLGREQGWVLTGPGRIRTLDRLPAERERLVTIARRMAGWLEKGWGPPVYRDRWVRVWDLDAVRSDDADGSSRDRSSSDGSSSNGNR